MEEETRQLPEVEIYVESSYKSPAKKCGVTMYLIQMKKDGKPYKDGMAEINVFTGTTMQQAEIRTMVKALDRFNKPCCVSFRMSDSCTAALVNRGYPKSWEKNGWQGSSGKIKNKADWEDLVVDMARHIHKGDLIKTGPHPKEAWMKEEIEKKLDEIEAPENALWLRSENRPFWVKGE